MRVRRFFASLLLVSAGAWAQTPTSCVACHSSDMFDEERRAIVTQVHDDIHAEQGLSCHDCHGGNPDPALADDPGAMDPAFAKNPYRGVPSRAEIPDFCGRCHSSPDIMNRFRPGMRVDQVQEYWTSRHGILLKKGDEKVATCTDCHGVHGIRPAADPRSPVYPTKVAETCSVCHSDGKRMEGRLPTDQFAKWQKSVHASSMFAKGDVSAPTCNDCHGNHGATPPGIASVAFVCGNCHGREAELFRASVKHEGFGRHIEMLGTVDESCASCHDGVPKRGPKVERLADCTTCHDNHGIVRPTIALLAPLPSAPCAFCHERNGPMAEDLSEPKKNRERYTETRDELLARAKASGITEDQELFDWLVARAKELPTHTIAGEVTEDGKPILRPEFARLFDKFRIGRTDEVFRRCNDCHMDPDAPGLRTAAALLTKMHSLTAATARAERVLLAAKRGGVEARKAEEELDGAVDSQIALEVLVHTFSAEGEFGKKHDEGMKHAAAALDAGQKSLAELSFRRRGLAISLVFIALFLVGLGWKIRQL